MRRLATTALLATMAAGSLAVWTAVPFAWLWLAGRFAGSNAISYLGALVVCPAVMVAVVLGLGRVERAYCRLAGRAAPTAVRPGWRRSISDSRRGPSPGGPLSTLLVVSAAIALLALVGWWAFGAGGQPSGPLAPGNEHTPK